MGIRFTLSSLTVALFTVACSGGGATATPTSAPVQVSTPGTSAGQGATVAVSLTDALRMEPTTITVPSGVPVTFVVTNAGAIDHEFYLGDEAAQAKHEAEMVSMGGMMHHDANGILVKPGESKSLTYTFSKGAAILAGCHVAGHYAGGMKAQIVIAS